MYRNPCSWIRNLRTGGRSLISLLIVLAFWGVEAGCRTQTFLTRPSISSSLMQIMGLQCWLSEIVMGVHNGVKETLTELRSEFWLARGRQVVKKLLHSCVTCHWHEGKPYQEPPQFLPEIRVKTAPAFTLTGLDYAGPLYIKGVSKKTGKKVWISLYTSCYKGSSPWHSSRPNSRSLP